MNPGVRIEISVFPFCVYSNLSQNYWFIYINTVQLVGRCFKLTFFFLFFCSIRTGQQYTKKKILATTYLTQALRLITFKKTKCQHCKIMLWKSHIIQGEEEGKKWQRKFMHGNKHESHEKMLSENLYVWWMFLCMGRNVKRNATRNHVVDKQLQVNLVRHTLKCVEGKKHIHPQYHNTMNYIFLVTFKNTPLLNSIHFSQFFMYKSMKKTIITHPMQHVVCEQKFIKF